MRLSFSFPLLATALGLALFAGKIWQPAQQAPKPPLKLAFVTNNPSDYWTIARKGVEKAERELGLKVDFQVPAGGTAAEQTQIVNDLLTKGTQGIAISPVDPENQTDLINSASRKALVFTQDSDAPHSQRACFVGADNVAAGRQAGEELKRVLPGGGEVMVFVGLRASSNATERIKGLQQGIGGSNIRILAVHNDDADRARAKANVEDALTQHPHLAGCVGLWSYNGPAILSALRDAHKTGKVKIVCFDEEDDTLTGIQKGEISATIVLQPFQFGYLSIINMATYLNGDKSIVPASKSLFIPTRVIRRDNVLAFQKQLQEWRR